MRRAELDGYESPDKTVGRAEPIEDENTGHSWLYLPDLSSQTGWASHHVPERQEKAERRAMGFRR